MIAHKAGGANNRPVDRLRSSAKPSAAGPVPNYSDDPHLSRSHRRFTEERKVKVIRSLVKETRITATGIEFEMYIEPTERAVEISAEENAQENFPQPASPDRGIAERALQ